MQTMETTQQWEAVITDLAAKQIAVKDRAEKLRSERRDMALEAAMAGANSEAGKRLAKVNAELSRIAAELGDLDFAMTQAEFRQREAEQTAAVDREARRQAEMAKIALQAIREATAFTVVLRKATEAGAEVKTKIHALLELATPEERRGLDGLLRPGAYQRAAEHAGLKNHIEFAGYTGPRQHLGPLEQEIAANLARWLTKPNSNGHGKES